MNSVSSRSCFEIDHTILDIQIENSDSGAKTEAVRPYLSTCTESRSRCVLASILRDRPPDQETIAATLYEAFLQRPGRSLAGFPHAIHVDINLLSPRLQQRLQRLGVVIYSPSTAGPSIVRGASERFFNQFSAHVRTALPGAMAGQNRDYSSRKFDLIQLRALLEEFVSQYNQRINPHTGKTYLETWLEQDIRGVFDDRAEVVLFKDFVPRQVQSRGISYERQLYWHPHLAFLVGQTVSICVKPLHTRTDPIEVFCDGQWICSAESMQKGARQVLPSPTGSPDVSAAGDPQLRSGVTEIKDEY